MKEKNKLGVILLTLAVTALFALLAGKNILELVKGPAPLLESPCLKDASGSYVSFDITRPVTSFPEEYYSGDPDRIKRMAYVVYDETQETFLKVVVAEHHKSGMERLLRAGQENRSGENLRPVTITGSLSSLSGGSSIREILDSMEDPESPNTQSMFSQAMAQKEWYVLEDGYIGGVPAFHLWICGAAIALNLLFLIIALVSLLTGKTTDASSGGGFVSQLLDQQKKWLEPWCRRGQKRRRQMAVIAILGAAAGLCALGFAAGASTQEITTCHLPLGFIMGELFGLPLLLGTGPAFNPDKILKRYRRNLEKSVSLPDDLETISRELLEADDQWSIQESGKENFHHGMVGEHYWAVFSGEGEVTLLDSRKLETITSETRSGQIRTGKIRTSYTFYAVCFYLCGSQKKHPDEEVNFLSSDTAGRFLNLMRKRLGEQAEHIIK